MKWDRSVARVEPTSSGETAVGFTFDTIAPSGLRMSYRITANEPDKGSSIELVAFFLAIPLLLTQRKALARDLQFLKQAIEAAG